MTKRSMCIKVLIFLVFLVPVLIHAQEAEDEDEDEYMDFPSQQNVTILSEEISGITANDLQFLKTVFKTSQETSVDNTGNVLLKPGTYTLPYASSSLPQDAYGFYGAKNLDDNNIETAWSEGVKGSGIGQWVAITSDDSFTAVVVNNGYYKDRKGWENNNRVQKARIRIFTFSKQSANLIRAGKSKVEYLVEFDDEYDDTFWQVWDGITGISQNKPASFLFILEILDVYRGTKYDDTCISNISLTVMQ